MNNLKYLQLSKPKGRAYADNEVLGHRENVKALSIQRTIDKFQLYNDSLYPINGNFPLTTWEDRFNITPLSGQTIAERTTEVKKKMDFPKGQMNRLSLSYIQSQIDYYGFDGITVEYNETGISTGYIHANNYTTTERFTIGLDKYNSFIVTGELEDVDSYNRMIRLLISLKPLDCFIVSKANYRSVLAIDSTTILALNATQALLLNANSNYETPNLVSTWLVVAGQTITLPTSSAGTVNWGDGTIDDLTTHTYTNAGTYQIAAKTIGDNWDFETYWGSSNSIITCEINSALTTMSFFGCNNLESGLESCDVNKLTSGYGMFSNCAKYNADLSKWDISNFTNTSFMFSDCPLFTSDLKSWNMSNVTEAGGMFANDVLFNSDLSNWSISNVTTFASMFYECTSFKSDLSAWDISNATVNYMLSGTNINETGTTTNYDNTLIAWSSLDLKSSQTFRAGTSQYSLDSVAQRTSIIDDSTWSISDGGLLEEGLKAWYDFKDIATEALDQYNSNDVAKTGTALITEDVTIGTSTRKGVSGFTVDNYFQDRNSSIFSLYYSGTVAITAWVKTDQLDATYGCICQIGEHLNNLEYYMAALYNGSSKLLYGACGLNSDTSSVFAKESYSEFSLMSIFFNEKDSTLSIFINGKLINTTENAVWSNKTVLTIGAYAATATLIPGLPFAGIISDISIWDEFSLEKHIQLYNEGNGLFFT